MDTLPTKTPVATRQANTFLLDLNEANARQTLPICEVGRLRLKLSKYHAKIDSNAELLEADENEYAYLRDDNDHLFAKIAACEARIRELKAAVNRMNEEKDAMGKESPREK